MCRDTKNVGPDTHVGSKSAQIDMSPTSRGHVANMLPTFQLRCFGVRLCCFAIFLACGDLCHCNDWLLKLHCLWPRIICIHHLMMEVLFQSHWELISTTHLGDPEAPLTCIIQDVITRKMIVACDVRRARVDALPCVACRLPIPWREEEPPSSTPLWGHSQQPAF